MPHLRRQRDTHSAGHGRRAAGRTGIARHGRLKEVTWYGSLGKGLGMVTAIGVVSALLFGSIVWANLFGGTTSFTIEEAEEVPALPQLEGGANILLVGSDDRTGQGAEFGEGQEDASGVLNDVNLLIHIAQDQSHATAISIPRDTIVDTPACRSDSGESVEAAYEVSFNSVLGRGGMSCVVAAAEELSGLDIQYAAMVRFRGVIEMSNAVGGVEVCVANEIADEYVGLFLQPGTHSLQGADALKFLRSRHGVGDGSDLARISNQQVFLSALIRTLKASDTLTNPAKVYGVARAVTSNMVLSDTLTIDTIVAMAVALANIPLENIVFAQLPVADSWYAGKVEPLQPDAEQLWQLLAADQPLQVQATATAEAPAETDGAASGEQGAEAGTGQEGAVGSEGDGADTAPTTSATDEAIAVPLLSGQTAGQQTCSNTEQ